MSNKNIQMVILTISVVLVLLTIVRENLRILRERIKKSKLVTPSRRA